MNIEQIDSKNIWYPPGGVLIWIIIFLELITFGAGLIAMVHYGSQELELFHTSSLKLNTTYGMLNTLFLITSGYFMAISVSAIKQADKLQFKKFLLLTLFFGCLFLGLKGFEYVEKLDEGLSIGYNTFFTFYWMLTLFHVIHVIVGIVILISVYIGINKGESGANIEDVKAGGAFWHMCDLIWMMLFPVLYLLF